MRKQRLYQLYLYAGTSTANDNDNGNNNRGGRGRIILSPSLFSSCLIIAVILTTIVYTYTNQNSNSSCCYYVQGFTTTRTSTSTSTALRGVSVSSYHTSRTMMKHHLQHQRQRQHQHQQNQHQYQQEVAYSSISSIATIAASRQHHSQTTPTITSLYLSSSSSENDDINTKNKYNTESSSSSSSSSATADGEDGDTGNSVSTAVSTSATDDDSITIASLLSDKSIDVTRNNTATMVSAFTPMNGDRPYNNNDDAYDGNDNNDENLSIPPNNDADADAVATNINTSSSSSNSRKISYHCKRLMVQLLTGQTLSSSSSSLPLRRPQFLENVIQNTRYKKCINNNNNKDVSSSSLSLTASIIRGLQGLLSKLLASIPTWVFHLRSSVQFVVTMVVYLIHTTIFTKRLVLFPFQLIPNSRGYFSSIGYDSLLGIFTLVFYQYLRKHQYYNDEEELQQRPNNNESSSPSSSSPSSSSSNDNTVQQQQRQRQQYKKQQLLPSLISKPETLNDMPWKNIWKSKYSRITSGITFVALVYCYYCTKFASIFWEDQLYNLGRYQFATWMTVPMHHSLQVLLGHTTWIVFGSLLLRWIPRPQPYFNYKYYTTIDNNDDSNNNNDGTSIIEEREQSSMWFKSRFKSRSSNNNNNSKNNNDDDIAGRNNDNNNISTSNNQWMWWVLGGYFVSCWLFQVTDFLNMYLFPIEIWDQIEDNNVVSKIINSNEIWSSIIGYVAPCLTAPWFEEILYRGFLLPTVLLWLPTSSTQQQQRHDRQIRIPLFPVVIPTILSKTTKSKNDDNNNTKAINNTTDTATTTPNTSNNTIINKINKIKSNNKYVSTTFNVLSRLRIRHKFLLTVNLSNYHVAVFISGVLFSAHHQQMLAFIPLCVLGWLWSIIYTKSQNLWTTIFIHALWNSRIFIGGWFGL